MKGMARRCRGAARRRTTRTMPQQPRPTGQRPWQRQKSQRFGVPSAPPWLPRQSRRRPGVRRRAAQYRSSPRPDAPDRCGPPAQSRAAPLQREGCVRLRRGCRSDRLQTAAVRPGTDGRVRRRSAAPRRRRPARSPAVPLSTRCRRGRRGNKAGDHDSKSPGHETVCAIAEFDHIVVRETDASVPAAAPRRSRRDQSSTIAVSSRNSPETTASAGEASLQVGDEERTERPIAEPNAIRTKRAPRLRVRRR